MNMSSDERMRRESSLIDTMRRKLPEFVKACAAEAKLVLLHQAINVKEDVVAGSGHWLMEGRPDYTVALIRKFLDGPPVAETVASGS